VVSTLLLWFFLALVTPASAQTATSSHPPDAARTEAGVLTPAQAEQALAVLKDDRKRADFIATLEALARVRTAGASATAQNAPAEVAPAPSAAAPATAPPGQPAGAAGENKSAEPSAKEPTLPLPLAPDSLGAQLLVGASDFLAQSSEQALSAARTVTSVPSLWGWVVVMATDPLARSTLLDAAWRLAVVLACGLAVEYPIWRAVRRTCAGLNTMARVHRARHPADTPASSGEDEPETLDAEAAAEVALGANDKEPGPEEGLVRAEEGQTEPPPRRRASPWTQLRRVPLVLTRLLLDLLPILAFAMVGHIVAGSTIGGTRLIQLVLLAVVDAYAVCRILLTLGRVAVSPTYPRLRLLPVQTATAAYVMRWLKRIIAVSVFGYAAAEAGLLLGMSEAAHEALLKAVGWVDHIFLAVIVLQKRAVVASWIAGTAEQTGVVGMLRRRFAAIWHWVALFYIFAIWLIWAVEIRNGYTLLLRFFMVTTLVLLAMRLALIVVLGTLDRALRVSPELSARHPGLEKRLRLYHPFLRSLLTAVIVTLTGLVLLQFWGANTLQWLASSSLGRGILSAVSSIAVTVAIALLIWEATNAAIQRHLAKLAQEAQLARSARLRTLLPLLRTTLLIVILVIVVLMILSEIGLNIGPLLAGAGIIGVAIGFGSQKLVQDLINGIFLLLENAMQVGDWVTVSGLSGTVENLSVRTIRLRAADGSVHIIPFSAVTSVTNTNRGIGNAAVEVTVAYDEDTDRVCDLLQEIAKGMRTEESFKPVMLSDLQLWGVDKISAISVTITGQIVCTDAGRWSVQREFNRRVKRRFQELGIQMPTPTQSLVIRGTLLEQHRPAPASVAEPTARSPAA
jgi:moderate conductance mechanosensitive channel